MKSIAIALATTVALVSAPAVQAGTKLTGEERLAKILDGRVAGDPVDCISLSRSRDATVIDKTAIVYGSGQTIYVNRPVNADQLNRHEVMVSEPRTGQLCKLDTVRMHDSSQFFYSGFVGLEEFVPYRRVAQAD